MNSILLMPELETVERQKIEKKKGKEILDITPPMFSKDRKINLGKFCHVHRK